MPDIHDQAMAWAQSNPQDPRAQDILAKAWASKNPNDPRAAQIMSKFSPPADTFQNKFEESVPTERVAPGMAGDRQLMMKLASNPKNQQAAVRALPAIGGVVGSAVGPEGTGLGAFLGGTAAAALGAGTGSMAENLISKDQSSAPEAVKNVGLDALFKGALPEAGGRAIGAAARGVGKAGDYLMQKAVGMKKYIPGVGETLADEGIIGTKNMMADQVEKALESRGSEIGELSKGISEVSTDTPAQAVFNRAQKLILPDGSIRPENLEEYNQLKQLADRITESGGEAGTATGEMAAAQRASAGKLAKKAGAYRLTNPSEGMKAGMYGSEQGGWSQALKDKGGEAMAEADRSYGALSHADRALSVPESIPHSFGGLLHKTIPGTPLAASLLGRGSLAAGDAGQAIGSIAPNTIRALQALLTPNTGR